MVQNVYLSNYELEDALKLFFAKIGPLNIPSEYIPTWEAAGRVVATAVYAANSAPHYNASAMDGIATKSYKTYGASERNQLELEEGKDYIVVDTGDPIPKEYDCVIMVEDVIKIDEKKVKIYMGAVPWQNIRLLGEDIVETEMIIPANHKIRPVDIGAILAGGVNNLAVYKKPVVGVIPTGTELVEPGKELQAGDIIDFNSRVFSAQVEEWGGTAKRYGIVKDIYEDIKHAIEKAAEECDIILINAGSSAGRDDYTSAIIGEIGEVFVHGIAIKPGKPVVLGSVKGKPIIGIPGYPVSAFFIMELIAKKLIEAFQGIVGKEPKRAKAIMSRRVMSSLKYQEFIRVKLGFVGEKLIATPITRGAGVTMSLVRADGILEIAQSVEGIEAGSEVEITLFKDIEEIKKTIICIGSHDPIVDILGDMLHQRNREFFLASAHVGSMGGITALMNNEVHIAPIHLLDMDSGEYNISYLKKYLGNRKIALIKCVKRIQGFVVPKGNPLNIKFFEDLINKKVSFMNRQRGSGTRLLLDYKLKNLQLNPLEIMGYEREAFTHLSVAAAVASGAADVGLAVLSVANAMRLDFVPVASEEYDFAVPEEFLELDVIKELIETLKSNDFSNKLDELGGYDYTGIGEIAML